MLLSNRNANHIGRCSRRTGLLHLKRHTPTGSNAGTALGQLPEPGKKEEAALRPNFLDLKSVPVGLLLLREVQFASQSLVVLLAL